MQLLEKNILENIRAGDKKAFELLFRAYFVSLLNYAREILKDQHLAEEMAEDVFVRLWERRERIRIETSIRAYLFRSIYNQCLNHFKHQKAVEKYRLFFVHHMQHDEVVSGHSADYPLSRIFNEELEHLVEKSIEKLPVQCKEIFMLSRFEDLGNEDIAKKLGISVSTVKTQISRALVKIRKDLHEVMPLL